MSNKKPINTDIDYLVECDVEPYIIKSDSLPVQKSTVESKTEVDEDFKRAKQSLYSILDTGEIALEKAKMLLELSDHPRTIESFSQLVNSLSTAAKDLLELHRQKKQVLKTDEVQTENKQTVTNNNLILTTDEVIKKIITEKKNG